MPLIDIWVDLRLSAVTKQCQPKLIFLMHSAAINAPIGKPAKRTIERDSAIVPGLIAESVLACASDIVGQAISSDYIGKLNTYAEDVYAHNRRFKAKLCGESGREYLHMHMQHWLAHLLRKDDSPLCRKLPRSFYWPERSWRG